MTQPPSSAARTIGAALMSLPMLGVVGAIAMTIVGMANRPPSDVAGLSGAAGAFLWAMGGWVTFLCAAIGAYVSFRTPTSHRFALFFVAAPLCLGIGVLLWDTSMGTLGLVLVAVYFLISLACLFVCPAAIVSARKQGKANPVPATPADRSHAN